MASSCILAGGAGVASHQRESEEGLPEKAQGRENRAARAGRPGPVSFGRGYGEHASQGRGGVVVTDAAQGNNTH